MDHKREVIELFSHYPYFTYLHIMQVQFFFFNILLDLAID